mmetsp:Transcript_27217/g.44650  ORF Transcript_27217/g.44650 Transcript_27217/m.44650 type:complete len:255 (+) Transcript_27217:379-1143(+)
MPTTSATTTTDIRNLSRGTAHPRRPRHHAHIIPTSNGHGHPRVIHLRRGLTRDGVHPRGTRHSRHDAHVIILDHAGHDEVIVRGSAGFRRPFARLLSPPSVLLLFASTCLPLPHPSPFPHEIRMKTRSQIELIPPLFLVVARRRAIVIGPARGRFFGAASGGTPPRTRGGTSIGGGAAIAARGATVVARTSRRGRGIVIISRVRTGGGAIAEGIGIVFRIRVGIVRVGTVGIDIEFGRAAAGGGAPPLAAEGAP